MKPKFQTAAAFACGLVWWSTASAQVEQVWIARYTNAFPRSVMVDRAGNVHVAATIGGSPLTLKYDTNGTLLWEAHSAASAPLEGGMALDHSGNVFVATGDSIEKYDSSGHKLWSVSPAFGNTSAWAVDRQGHVFVPNESSLTKYDPDGNELWKADLVADSGGGVTRSLVLDPAGHAYVVAAFPDPNGLWSAITLKFDADGKELWRVPFDGGDVYKTAAVASDGGGNVYVASSSIGHIVDCLCPPLEVTTAKYDTNGNEIWATRFSGWNPWTGSSLDVGGSIAMDNDTNVFLTVKRPRGCRLCLADSALVKLDSHGNQLWVARRGYGGDLNSLKLDRAGNAYVTDRGSLYLGHSTVVKYDRSGNQRWAVPISAVTDMDLDETGNVYAVGYGYSDDEPRMTMITVKLLQADVPGVPVITTQPQSQTVLPETNVTLAVVASGAEPLSYQWRFDARDIPDATNATLAFVPILPWQWGDYSVVVSNTLGVTVSPEARLNVLAPAPALVNPHVTPQGLQFTLVGTLGRRYAIEYTHDLSRWQLWNYYLASESGTHAFTDSGSIGSQRFFRARLLP